MYFSLINRILPSIFRLNSLEVKLSFVKSRRFGATKSEAIIFYFRSEKASVEGWGTQAAAIGQTVEPGAAF